jgi:gamma-glutamyl:cysteine ligase YbdK (ATP-grasp superfamily)
MAKLSELVKKIEDTAKQGDREKALRMLENLLEKVPEEKAQPLLKRRKQYRDELVIEKRISALEQKYGA